MLTEKEKLFRTQRRSIYLKWGLIIAGIVIAVLVWKGCGNENATNSRIDAMQARLQEVLSDSARKESIARGYKNAKEDMDLRYAELLEEKNILQQKVRNDGDQISSLSGAIKKAKENKDTVTLIDSCIDLANKVEYYKAWMDEVWAYETKQDSIQNVRIRISDSLVNHWEKSYRGCLAAAVFVATELPKVKPKGKLYIDGAATTGYINSVGGGFSFIDTKGNKFGGKVFVTTDKPLYMAEYGRLLSFKKRN